MKITAAVVHERSRRRSTIETLDLCDPRPDELLVEVVASGMCATDLHGRDGYYPHAVSRSVRPRRRRHRARDRLGRDRIQARRPCRDGLSLVRRMPELPQRSGRPIACTAGDLKNGGTRADGSTLHSKDGKPVYSAFFQQSSFGNFTIANERFAVKVRNDVPLDDRLRTCLRRADRRRRGAQCDEAATRRQLRRCSASARSACPV